MKLPEIVFGTEDKDRSYEINRYVKLGKLRRLLPRVYTSRMEEEDDTIVRRNLWQLIAVLFPESILSHRTSTATITCSTSAASPVSTTRARTFA